MSLNLFSYADDMSEEESQSISSEETYVPFVHIWFY